VWIAKLAPAGLQHLLPSSLPLLLDLEKARTHGLFLLLPFFSSCNKSNEFVADLERTLAVFSLERCCLFQIRNVHFIATDLSRNIYIMSIRNLFENGHMVWSDRIWFFNREFLPCQFQRCYKNFHTVLG
jgi:hypothetical protein